MKRHRIFSIAITATALSLLLAGGALATEEMAEREDLVCTVCHDKPGSKLLTDQGKFYEMSGTLDGYAEIETTFGNCTFCHRRKPGSKKLTPAGRGFAKALGGMDALVEWVRERHPGWPDPTDEVPEATGETSGAEAREESPELEPVPSH